MVTSANSITVTVGKQFTYQIVATNSPTSYGATNLPDGLTVDSGTGIISGVPTTSGSQNVSLSATNSDGTGLGSLAITVQAAPTPGSPVITSGTSATARTNQPFTFQITATGVSSDATLTSTPLPGGLTLDSATGLISGTPTQDGSFAITLTLHDGDAIVSGSLQLTFTSDPAFPVITSPAEVHLVSGQPFTYTIHAPVDGSEPAVFSISGTLPPGLTFDPATGTISGTYNPGGATRAGVKGRSTTAKALTAPGGSVIETVTLIAHNSHGTATLPLSFLVPLPTAAVNISTRGVVSPGAGALIGGFIVTGDAPKKVLIRAIGPSLNVNGTPIVGTLPDPLLRLFDVNNTLLQTNDNWQQDQADAITATGAAPTDPHESAMVVTLSPGNYTAQVTGAQDKSTGIALVEIYDTDTASSSHLAEISTRGAVSTGDNVLIGGFIIAGDAATSVLVRAIGPELTDRGVAGALTDTTLELHDANGALLAQNDNWRTDQEQAIKNTGVPPVYDKESAILTSASAGHYTAIVRGKDQSTGVGLVEVYVLK